MPTIAREREAGPVDAAARAAFHALSKARGARVFHPEGVGYEGTFTVGEPQPGYAGVPLLDRPGEHRALVRMSRAIGLPDAVPDILGVSFRLPDLHGPGDHQDFLLASSGGAPLLRHLLLPAPRGFLGHTYSSLLAYRIGERLRLVGARPAGPHPPGEQGRLDEVDAAAADGRLRFELLLAPLTGRWTPVATFEAHARMSSEETERIALTPWNTGGGIRPVGPLMRLRRAAYRGSQRGRGLEESEIP